ncbi:MAG: trimethylamine methyltransferase family protein [Deltaproteobacteria bacterium]|jgi:trimethylamine--corrinoid protein Co-methyltransferase|nr:trimethylamine methyltransferase family protein [Deltaproteobacteria bacterium]
MGHEKTLTGLMAALAGANLIYGPGMLESGITFDFGQLVMDNEFARMIKHTINGFSINAESLAVNVIGEIGPARDFLMHEHTFRHMRSQSIPELIDRKGMQEWKASGSRDIYLRATQEARNILDNHQPEPLPDGVCKEIQSIIRETEAELGVSKK